MNAEPDPEIDEAVSRNMAGDILWVSPARLNEIAVPARPAFARALCQRLKSGPGPWPATGSSSPPEKLSA